MHNFAEPYRPKALRLPPGLGPRLAAELDELQQENGGPSSMKSVFAELERRFVKGSVKDAVSFYFSLGAQEKWTLWLDQGSCRVQPGKPRSGHQGRGKFAW